MNLRKKNPYLSEIDIEIFSFKIIQWERSAADIYKTRVVNKSWWYLLSYLPVSGLTCPGLVAAKHMGSSQPEDQTGIPYIARQSLNH